MTTAALSHPKAERIWTYDEMPTELPETNAPMELWDGEIITSPSPSFFHQDIVLRFFKLLDGWVAPRRLGKTTTAPLDMVLAPNLAVQPDVMFVSNERRQIIQRVLMGAADLVLEVISPGTRHRDHIEKRDLYEQHGVKEYWIADPDAQTVEVLFLENQQYKLAGHRRPGETARSRLLEGFEVDVMQLLSTEE